MASCGVFENLSRRRNAIPRIKPGFAAPGPDTVHVLYTPRKLGSLDSGLAVLGLGLRGLAHLQVFAPSRFPLFSSILVLLRKQSFLLAEDRERESYYLFSLFYLVYLIIL